MLAVISDALVQGYDKERDWFDSDEDGHPFTFEVVCQALGLSSSALRRRLRGGLRVKASQLADTKRVVKHGMRPGINKKTASKKTRRST